jgi:NTP pyrophosphatase (non-canonical NTP hydrolase)
MSIGEFQALIERIYGAKDASRGTAGTFMWFAEEVGELSRALRRGERRNLEEEFADVLAWLSTLASLHGVDLDAVAARKYGGGCPRCHAAPCACDEPVARHAPPAL